MKQWRWCELQKYKIKWIYDRHSCNCSLSNCKRLGHAQIGHLYAFSSKFPTSISAPVLCGSPPPLPTVDMRSLQIMVHQLNWPKYIPYQGGLMSSFDVPALIHVMSDPDLGQDCANRMHPSLDSPLFCFIFINLVNCRIYMMFKATHLTLNLRNIKKQ